MLGRCASTASAFVLCLLLIDMPLQSARAGESEAASVLVVPAPVPAIRRPAIAPLPPAPAPIENLAGKWSGQATMVPTAGRNEQFRCTITYQVGEDGSRVRQHLRCQGENRSFDAVTRLDIAANKVTGVWADNVYSISGTLHGNVTDKGFNIQLRSTYFDAKMSVVSSDCLQTVRVIPDDSSVGMKELAATLKKC